MLVSFSVPRLALLNRLHRYFRPQAGQSTVNCALCACIDDHWKSADPPGLQLLVWNYKPVVFVLVHALVHIVGVVQVWKNLIFQVGLQGFLSQALWKGLQSQHLEIDPALLLLDLTFLVGFFSLAIFDKGLILDVAPDFVDLVRLLELLQLALQPFVPHRALVSDLRLAVQAELRALSSVSC